MDYATITSALEIFKKYQPDNLRIDTRAGCIYAGPEPYDIHDDDMSALSALGWEPSYSYECFSLVFDDTILPDAAE